MFPPRELFPGTQNHMEEPGSPVGNPNPNPTLTLTRSKKTAAYYDPYQDEQEVDKKSTVIIMVKLHQVHNMMEVMLMVMEVAT